MGETTAKTFKNKIINILIHVSFPEKIEDYEHIIVSIIDITKSKSLEQEIQEMYKFICKSPVVLFKWDNKNGWPVKFVTNNVYQLTGYLPDDFMNKNIFRNSIIHPEDLVIIEKLTQAYIEIGGGEYRQEYRIVTKNKETKWVRENGFSVAKSEEDCEVEFFTTMMFDITEEKRLKDKSSENLKKFKNLLETTKTAFVILNGYNEIYEANDVFYDLVKCEDRKLLLGKKFIELPIPEDRSKIKRAFERLENGMAIEDLEVCFKIEDQKESIWVRINANIMENGERKTFCLVRDITSKKVEEFKKYIENQKQKDKLKQNINKIRENIQDIINIKPPEISREGK